PSAIDAHAGRARRVEDACRGRAFPHRDVGNRDRRGYVPAFQGFEEELGSLVCAAGVSPRGEFTAVAAERESDEPKRRGKAGTHDLLDSKVCGTVLNPSGAQTERRGNAGLGTAGEVRCDSVVPWVSSYGRGEKGPRFRRSFRF